VMFIFFIPHKSLFYVENLCDIWHHVLCYGVSFFLACMCA
jgi:hypothetical protein